VFFFPELCFQTYFPDFFQGCFFKVVFSKLFVQGFLFKAFYSKLFAQSFC